MMRKRVLAILLALAIASLASADASFEGASAFALYSTGAVFTYLVAIVIVEAWIIGHRLNITWARSFITSIAANFVTALVAIIFGIPTVGMVLFGGLANPNPFLSTVLLLIVFGLASGVFESLFWNTVRGETPKRTIFNRTMLAHIVGIPLGLLIFLIPPRPYPGLEDMTRVARKLTLGRALQGFSRQLAVGQPVPNVHSAAELLSYVASHSTHDMYENNWAAATFAPKYGRFDVGNKHGWQMEFNAAIVGRSLDKAAQPTWILRTGPDRADGFVYDPAKKRIVETYLPPDLGY